VSKIKFDFIETPGEMLDTADVLMPHLSTSSERDLQKMKDGVRDCDAVCLPPGYDHTPPCDCKANLA
jgi:hypothetical protein